MPTEGTTQLHEGTPHYVSNVLHWTSWLIRTTPHQQCTVVCSTLITLNWDRQTDDVIDTTRQVNINRHISLTCCRCCSNSDFLKPDATSDELHRILLIWRGNYCIQAKEHGAMSYVPCPPDKIHLDLSRWRMINVPSNCWWDHWQRVVGVDPAPSTAASSWPCSTREGRGGGGEGRDHIISENVQHQAALHWCCNGYNISIMPNMGDHKAVAQTLGVCAYMDSGQPWGCVGLLPSFKNRMNISQSCISKSG